MSDSNLSGDRNATEQAVKQGLLALEKCWI